MTKIVNLTSWKIKKIDVEVDAILLKYGSNRKSLVNISKDGLIMNRTDKKRLIELLEIKLLLERGV